MSKGIEPAIILTKGDQSPDNATSFLNENARGKAAEMMRTLAFMILPIGWVVVAWWDSCRCG